MRIRNIYCLLLPALLIACKTDIKKAAETQPVSTISGSWQLANAEFPDSAKYPEKIRAWRRFVQSGALHNSMLFSFFPDGSFTIAERKKFGMGKWIYADGKRAVRFLDSNRTQTLFIKHSTEGGKQILGLTDPAVKMQIKFSLYADSLKDYHNDPFYLSNNLWRKPALQPETDAELQKRLANYFQHLLYILQSALERNQQEVTFEFSPGIVKIYAGGIGVVNKNEVPAYWVKTFYDTAQAGKAYKMFYDYMHRTPFYGKGTGNWLKDDHMILQNIYNDLQNGKFNAVKKPAD